MKKLFAIVTLAVAGILSACGGGGSIETHHTGPAAGSYEKAKAGARKQAEMYQGMCRQLCGAEYHVFAIWNEDDTFEVWDTSDPENPVYLGKIEYGYTSTTAWVRIDLANGGTGVVQVGTDGIANVMLNDGTFYTYDLNNDIRDYLLIEYGIGCGNADCMGHVPLPSSGPWIVFPDDASRSSGSASDPAANAQHNLLSRRLMQNLATRGFHGTYQP